MIDISSPIRDWLNAHPADRDPAAGALLLLRLDRNQVFYRAVLANPSRHLPTLESRLRAHLTRRLSLPSHEQAKALAKEADEIMSPEQAAVKAMKGGRRPDHESLPPEIQRLYADNLDLRHRMQQIHLQIRTLLSSGSECSRQDIADLVVILRDADIKYHDNWKLYDAYGTGG